ncbi:DUF3060 domain-containing protein [Curtobacterium herbarum]|uniref:DUF3060 domain-containing protein n=1 Tax=Curtobacterium herbarum TaxID=150122 RepID=UPI001C8E234F|nr:DUF3060 domain-containing protein [Curtobacterium herbarum]MBY0176283.1 DUF3060 domain-containing protein [Curtobacterium herbarum]
MRTIRTLATATVAVALALGATACSGGDQKTPTPSPTASIVDTVYNECIDGAVQLWDEDGDDEPITAKDCDAANLISSERSYQLDGIKVITVEASKTTIDVSDAERVVITGDDNTVRWTGSEPAVEDQGQGNTVTPA